MLSLLVSALSVSYALSLDCSAPKEVGNFCEDPTTRMFYYDPRYKVCQPFQYRGCGGNENRFETAQECKSQCTGSGAAAQSRQSSQGGGGQPSSVDEFVPVGKAHDQWRKADKCGSNYLIPNGRYESCSPSCPPNHQCTQGVCCPTKDYVCSLLDDNGTFQEGIEDKPRFGWNHEVQSCVRFSYYGANGNYNNFPNFYSCMNYCKDAKKMI